MASGGTVEIQVELEGANKVQGRLNQLGQGATVAGSKFTAAGDALASSSNLMASSLGTVVSSVGTLTQGIGGLTAATTTAGARRAGRPKQAHCVRFFPGRGHSRRPRALPDIVRSSRVRENLRDRCARPGTPWGSQKRGGVGTECER